MTSYKMVRRELLKRMGMTATALALSACVPVAPGAGPAAGANSINQAVQDTTIQDTTRRTTMRMMLKISLPVETFNKLALEGTVGHTIGMILEETKPESFYFTGNRYGRGAIAVFDLQDSSELPRVAEPWFLIFNAEIEYGPAITPEELMKAGLDEIIKKWA
jgi:hypothetical protein